MITTAPIETRQPKPSQAVTGWTADHRPWVEPNLAITVANDPVEHEPCWLVGEEIKCSQQSSSSTSVVCPSSEVTATYTLTTETIVAALKELVELGATPSARSLLAIARRLVPSAELALRRWGHALAVPVPHKEKSASGQATADNYRWLDQNRGAYAGQWVALRGGVLLDADLDRLMLYRRLKKKGNLGAVFFAKAPIG